MVLSLERSKGVPLRLWLDNTFSDRRKLRDLIAPYIQNTETLEFFDLTTIEDLMQVLPNFPQSMPILRSLLLEHLNDESEWDPSIDPFKSFPDTLRSLSLHEVPLYPSFLKLRTLTELSLRYHDVHLPLDTLLDFLEENRSLDSVELVINYSEFLAQISQRRTVVLNQLHYLSIACWDVMIGRTLVSSIPLRRGAHLEITSCSNGTGSRLNDILSDIPVTHLSNLSPNFMEYQSDFRLIRLIGPNGNFTYTRERSPGMPFAEFPVLPLTNIRELRLVHTDPSMVFPPSSFPALQTLTTKCDTSISHLFSALFPDPSLFPSLKALGFLDCIITEEFMEELARFASSRKDTSSAWLHRVVIINQDCNFPAGASIRELRRHVPIVDVRFDTPADLI